MTDIHSHILPCVDDGSGSMEESLLMLKAAAECGADVIAATPHFDSGKEYPGAYFETLADKLSSLRQETAFRHIRLAIVRGMEIMASERLPELLAEGLLWTLGGTDYFLVEFASDDDPDRCSRILRRCKQRGFLPIIAHPERYRFVRRAPQIAYEWCRSGYGLQINKGSLLGRFGEGARDVALRLISHGLAACVASDAHGAYRRTTDMREVRTLLNEEFGEDHADLLLERNPDRILAGKELRGFEPYPFI